MRVREVLLRVFVFICLIAFPKFATAQSNSGSISGTVVDPSGAIVAGAAVTIDNPVTGYNRSTTTDESGNFSFSNIPFNPYHLTGNAKGFAVHAEDVDVRSVVPINLKIAMSIAGSTTTVTVEAGGDLIENQPTFHTDVDRALFDRLPLESQSSSVSSLVTLASPGIAADSNGLFHGLGDHAENSFSIDGQPITDQQSKIFSNQIPIAAVQSLEVIGGAPPAEYGDKTSLIINVTTRSGLGDTTPHGTVYGNYGTFGTSSAGFDFAYGGQKWGNFIAVNGLNTGRFLDPPEFIVNHAKGNEENVFDRVDYQPSTANSIHLNVGYTRSWFQNPTSFDEQNHPCPPFVAIFASATYPCNAAGTSIINVLTGAPLGPTDQRSKIETFNIAPSWTHLINSTTVFTLGAFVRRDGFNYYPSAVPLNDLAPDLQAETAIQDRTLTNAGALSNISIVKGIHNIKAGIVYEQTFLTENDKFGIVDPTFNPVCFNADGSPNTNPAVNMESQCGGPLDPGGTPNAKFNPLLSCLDLTRPTPAPANGCASPTSALFFFHGHTDVKQLAMYVQDTITKGSWSFNLGIRGDVYTGISHDSQAEPRLGVAYNIKQSNTVLRVSYARTLETPFNENLVIASEGCGIPVLAAIVPPPGVTCNLGAIRPGFRNEFHAGLQQAFGKYLVIDAEYIWKYTHNGYDFGIVGATPITFPIEWHNSKIPGFALRASVPNFHGLTALVVMSSVAARFFLPQVAGLPIIPPSTGVFRIDHDEHFNQTTHLQYQPRKYWPWIGFNWRYDSGLVAGSTPCFNPATATCTPTSAVIGGVDTILLLSTITGLPLTADQEFQAGFFCGNFRPTQTVPIPGGTCPASEFGSTKIKVPAPNTENDDHNPQRIQPRHVFDFAVGDDNLFRGDRFRWSAQVTVINATNKDALYNFLSTFSGTHYVTPRAISGEIGFHF